MGKKDDWCSCKGLKNRKAGLDKKESTGRKVCYSLFFGTSAVVFLGIAGVQLWRADNAARIDKHMNDTASMPDLGMFWRRRLQKANVDLKNLDEALADMDNWLALEGNSAASNDFFDQKIFEDMFGPEGLLGPEFGEGFGVPDDMLSAISSETYQYQLSSILSSNTRKKEGDYYVVKAGPIANMGLWSLGADRWYDLCILPEQRVHVDEWDLFIESNEAAMDMCDADDVDCVLKGTQWRQVWEFNGSIMLIMALNLILLTFGACCFWPRLIGTYMNCALSLCNCSGAAVGFAYVLSPAGVACMLNGAENTMTEENEYMSGMTYRTEGSLILIFAIA